MWAQINLLSGLAEVQAGGLMLMLVVQMMTVTLCASRIYTVYTLVAQVKLKSWKLTGRKRSLKYFFKDQDPNYLKGYCSICALGFKVFLCACMHNCVLIILYDYKTYPIKLSVFKVVKDLKYKDFSDFITWFLHFKIYKLL